MKKIFITGTTSFLGETIFERLKNKFELIALEHNKPLKNPLGISVVQGSLENISSWQDKVPQVDFVIHLAGLTHSKNLDLYTKINTGGTMHLIDAPFCRGIQQFIYISTRAIGENCGEYGESKKKAEEYLKKSGIPYTIIRVSEVYEETFKTKEGLGGIARLIQKSPVIPYFSKKNVLLAPIHRDDVTEAILNSIGNPLSINKTYTLAGQSLTMKEVMKKISVYYKKKNLLIPIPTIIAKIIFFIFGDILKILIPDQLKRLSCKKNNLSENVLIDLKINPKKFLI